jgi:hypothetical protein
VKNKQKDLKNVARREKYFSTLAKKEGQGAAKRAHTEAKKGMKASAKDSKWEEGLDKTFAKIRSKKAADAEKKIK